MDSQGSEQITEANSAKYNDGSEVAAYLTEPYHVKRIELAIGLLIKELSRSNPDSVDRELSILELGSAGGETAVALAGYGYEVTASDLVVAEGASQEALPNLRFIELDASGRFPLADSSFDAIFAGELIEHLFDTTLFLNECYRVLKGRGTLVLTTPNLATWQDRLTFLFGFSPRQVDPIHKYLRLHIRPFNARSLRCALEHCGFRQRALLSNYVVLRLNSGRRVYSRLLARYLPTIGGSLIVAAQKDVDGVAV